MRFKLEVRSQSLFGFNALHLILKWLQVVSGGPGADQQLGFSRGNDYPRESFRSRQRCRNMGWGLKLSGCTYGVIPSSSCLRGYSALFRGIIRVLYHHHLMIICLMILISLYVGGMLRFLAGKIIPLSRYWHWLTLFNFIALKPSELIHS